MCKVQIDNTEPCNRAYLVPADKGGFVTWVLLSLFLSSSGIATWKTIEARYWRRQLEPSDDVCQCGHERCYHHYVTGCNKTCRCEVFTPRLRLLNPEPEDQQ